MICRLASVLIVVALTAPGALAQVQVRAQAAPSEPPPPPPPMPAVFPNAQAQPVVAKKADPAPGKDQAKAAQKAITRQNPLPRRVAAFRPNAAVPKLDPLPREGGFANPGGVGRYLEYYTPNTPITQANYRQTRVAGFDQGGGPSRADQINAFRVGQIRARNIQNNINAYGRPYGAYGVGFGYGYGLGVGRGYGGFY